MKNPFAPIPDPSPELEAAVAAFFAPLATVSVSPQGAALAERRMAVALAARPIEPAWPPLARRAVVAAASLAAPFVAVGAVGALTGNETLQNPVTLVSHVANRVGITNAEIQQPQPRPTIPPAPSGQATAQNAAPPPRIVPGATASAGRAVPPLLVPPPALSGVAGCPAVGCVPPLPRSAANGDGGGQPRATDNASGSPDRTGPTQGSANTADPRLNGKGCSDGSGGTAGCDAGNSAEHRQNGTQQPAVATPTAATGRGPENGSSNGTSGKDSPGNARGSNSGSRGGSGNGGGSQSSGGHSGRD